MYEDDSDYYDVTPRIEPCALCGFVGPHANYRVVVEVEGTVKPSLTWIFLCSQHAPSDIDYLLIFKRQVAHLKEAQ